MSSTASWLRPIIAAIEPSPSGTASCMSFALTETIFNASLNSITPPATKAAYSPNECPAKAPKEFEFRSSSLHKAILEANIKGCVISVLARSSFLSEKIRDLKSTSKISLASSKVLEKIVLLSK